MRTRSPFATLLVATVAFSACSSDTRQSLKTDAQSVITDVGNAVGGAANDAAEALARNIATQQGEEQFKNAGQTLDGPLTCEATVDAGVTKVDISCTGKTSTGGAATLTGSTNEVPGASVIELDGQFTGAVDGTEVFTTERLGG